MEVTIRNKTEVEHRAALEPYLSAFYSQELIDGYTVAQITTTTQKGVHPLDGMVSEISLINMADQ